MKSVRMEKQELLKLWRVMANGGDPFPYLNHIALEAQIEHIIPTDGEKDSEGIEQRLLLQYGVHKDGQAVGMVYPPHHVVGISTTFKDQLRYLKYKFISLSGGQPRLLDCEVSLWDVARHAGAALSSLPESWRDQSPEL